jgi:hypothetical protein
MYCDKGHEQPRQRLQCRLNRLFEMLEVFLQSCSCLFLKFPVAETSGKPVQLFRSVVEANNDNERLLVRQHSHAPNRIVRVGCDGQHLLNFLGHLLPPRVFVADTAHAEACVHCVPFCKCEECWRAPNPTGGDTAVAWKSDPYFVVWDRLSLALIWRPSPSPIAL